MFISIPRRPIIDIVLTPKRPGLDLPHLRHAAEFAIVRASEEAARQKMPIPTMDKPVIENGQVIISVHGSSDELVGLEEMDVDQWDPILAEVEISLRPRSSTL